jgi:hypothetical protein
VPLSPKAQLSCCPVSIARMGTPMCLSGPEPERALATWPCRTCCSKCGETR